MEDVILGRHLGVAGIAAIAALAVRAEAVGRGGIDEPGIPPSAGLGETLAVLLDEEDVLVFVRHVDDKGRVRALLLSPLDFGDLGAVGERFAIAGNAGAIGGDHGGIGDNRLQYLIGLGQGDDLPALISPEVGE